ncbi:hypothetical protein TeGR_g9338 [Tetraparma gracilis]|uniref:Phosphodeoxyriboaldolase n=1 Tax=Tetraparma gracilis TaxID=2962635 RepID=A0ABQ6N8V0_9STRA|nr:hypothetical protein TeGR_g9338 [Tetraparma gracilis]
MDPITAGAHSFLTSYLPSPPPAPAPLPATPPALPLASFIDHTLLSPSCTSRQISALCSEARAHSFAAVCVPPAHVAACVTLLAGTPVRVCAVVGFPHGNSLPSSKAAEAADCLSEGATEIDMVINVSNLKDLSALLSESPGGAVALIDPSTSAAAGSLVRALHDDMEAVAAAVHRVPGALLKVIVETCLLTPLELRLAALAFRHARGVSPVGEAMGYIKTSTGFNGAGARVEDVRVMSDIVRDAGASVKCLNGAEW